MAEKQKKRFIAGAKCPQCGEMDTLMLFWRDNVEQVECVRCGYHKSRPQDTVNKAARENESVIGVFKPE